MTNREMNAIKNPELHKEGLKLLVKNCLLAKNFALLTIDEVLARHEMLTALGAEKVLNLIHELVAEHEAWEGQDADGITLYARFPAVLPEGYKHVLYVD